jgi:hypothetical protein
MLRKKIFSVLSSFIVCLGFSSAFADTGAPPRPQMYLTPSNQLGNYWLVTFYDDTDPNHQQWATQGLCFSPLVARGQSWEGRVVSLTYPNWSGRYYTSGGNTWRIKMNYAPDGQGNFNGNDFIGYELYTAHTGSSAGDAGWNEWRDSFMWNVWGNVGMQRVGKCSLFNGVPENNWNELIMRRQAQVQPRLTSTGKLATEVGTPGQPDPRQDRSLQKPEEVSYGLS